METDIEAVRTVLACPWIPGVDKWTVNELCNEVEYLRAVVESRTRGWEDASEALSKTIMEREHARAFAQSLVTNPLKHNHHQMNYDCTKVGCTWPQRRAEIIAVLNSWGPGTWK